MQRTNVSGKDWEVIEKFDGLKTVFVADFTWCESKEFQTEIEAVLFAIAKSYYRWDSIVDVSKNANKMYSALLGVY
jgi:hypothetical protein